MNIQIISDIHLEFGKRDFSFTNCDIVIFAGDVDIGKNGLKWILKEITDVPVIYILGNHEYYKNAYPKLLNKIKQASQGTNVYVLENESVIIGNITFHGMSLWTNFELFGNANIAGYYCQDKMNDYHKIRRDPSYSKMRPADTQTIHQYSFNWLKKSLRESTTQLNVIISHHAPSLKSIPEEMHGDMITAAYASNLESFILDEKPDLWIHGHIHKASDYYIGKTRIICNPCGYPYEEVENFKDNLIVKINSREI